MIQPIRPSHVRVPSPPKPRTPKNHRIYINVTDYREIKKETFEYDLNLNDKLTDVVSGDLIIFEKIDYFTRRRTKRTKVFMVESCNHLKVKLVPFFPDDKPNQT